jgi:hypothetical protein
MRRFTAILLAVLWLYPQPTAAQDSCAQPSPTPPDAALMHQHLAWIADHSPYADTAARIALPDIAFCRPGEDIPLGGEDMLVEPDMRAAYDPDARRIFLTLPWDAEDTFDSSILLHELVHHVQMQARGWDCINAAEWEAYHLQDTWLRDQGVMHEFDWMQIFFLSRCPHSPHPD